jgi:hypothetical protein
MSAAAVYLVLVIGSLSGMTTLSPRPVPTLTAELGEAIVLAVEAPASLVAGCAASTTPITMS